VSDTSIDVLTSDADTAHEPQKNPNCEVGRDADPHVVTVAGDDGGLVAAVRLQGVGAAVDGGFGEARLVPVHDRLAEVGLAVPLHERDADRVVVTVGVLHDLAAGPCRGAVDRIVERRAGVVAGRLEEEQQIGCADRGAARLVPATARVAGLGRVGRVLAIAVAVGPHDLRRRRRQVAVRVVDRVPTAVLA
jgi:hypothetical protein